MLVYIFQISLKYTYFFYSLGITCISYNRFFLVGEYQIFIHHPTIVPLLSIFPAA
jgi:hypothetical protein